MVSFEAELAIVLLFSLIGGLVAVRFRQPAVVGLLIAGALIGPNALGLVSQSELIENFAELGAVFLLFTIGVHFSASKLMRIGVRAMVIAALKLAIVFTSVYEVALLVGLSLFEAFILGAILSITSTALVARMLQDMRAIRKLEASVMIATLIIEDVYAVFLLMLFSNVETNGGALQYRELLVPLLSALVTLAAVYLVVGVVMKELLKWTMRQGSDEALVLAALSLAVGFSYAAGAVGLEPSIGAFIGGSLAAAMPGGRVIERSMMPFTASFSAIFFLSMGMLVDPSSLVALLPLIVLFSLVNIGSKFLGMGLSVYLTGMRAKQAVFAGLGMLSVGEFSLLLSRAGAPLVGFDLVGFTASIVVISAVASSLVAGREEQVHVRIAKSLPKGMLTSLARFSQYFRSVIRSFEPGGKSFRTFVREGGRLVLNGSSVIAVVGSAVLFMPYMARLTDLPLGYAALVAAIIVSAKPLSMAFRSMREIMDDFSDAFLHFRKKRSITKMNERLRRDAVLFMFFILLSMNMPLLLTLLRLGGFWPLSYIALALSALLVWDMSRVLRALFRRARIRQA